MMSLQQAAKAIGGSVRGGGAYFTRVVTDSRGSVKDSLFVALPGPVFDGHRYAATAMRAGAVACMLERQLRNVSPSLQVNDCRQALGRLAGHWRQHLPTRICAITGSNGKTTVKEMLAAILRQSASVTSTRGNQNNEIGLPLTLLRIRSEDRFAVVEMGMNHPGEIAALGELLQPDAAVVTCIGQEHMEFFGDLRAVAEEEACILRSVSPPERGGKAFIETDAYRWIRDTAAFNPEGELIVYGLGAEGACGQRENLGERQRFSIGGSVHIDLPLIAKAARPGPTPRPPLAARLFPTWPATCPTTNRSHDQ